MRIYLDTCIWLDFYFKRGNHSIAALQLFQKALTVNAHVFVSDVVIKELRHLGLPMESISALFRILKPVIRYIHVSRTQSEEARKLGETLQIPRADALHAVLARDCDSVIVTRDHHFRRLTFVTARRPEDLL